LLQYFSFSSISVAADDILEWVVTFKCRRGCNLVDLGSGGSARLEASSIAMMMKGR